MPCSAVSSAAMSWRWASTRFRIRNRISDRFESDIARQAGNAARGRGHGPIDIVDRGEVDPTGNLRRWPGRRPAPIGPTCRRPGGRRSSARRSPVLAPAAARDWLGDLGHDASSRGSGQPRRAGREAGQWAARRPVIDGSRAPGDGDHSHDRDGQQGQVEELLEAERSRATAPSRQVKATTKRTIAHAPMATRKRRPSPARNGAKRDRINRSSRMKRVADRLVDLGRVGGQLRPEHPPWAGAEVGRRPARARQQALAVGPEDVAPACPGRGR